MFTTIQFTTDGKRKPVTFEHPEIPGKTLEQAFRDFIQSIQADMITPANFTGYIRYTYGVELKIFTPGLYLFNGAHIYRGINAHLYVLAKSVSEVSELTGLTKHQIKTYFGKANRRDGYEERVVYLSFDSGELCYSHPELKNKPILRAEFEALVDKHREECATYQDTIKKYGNE